MAVCAVPSPCIAAPHIRFSFQLALLSCFLTSAQKQFRAKPPPSSTGTVSLIQPTVRERSTSARKLSRPWTTRARWRTSFPRPIRIRLSDRCYQQLDNVPTCFPIERLKLVLRNGKRTLNARRKRLDILRKNIAAMRRDPFHARPRQGIPVRKLFIAPALPELRAVSTKIRIGGRFGRQSRRLAIQELGIYPEEIRHHQICREAIGYQMMKQKDEKVPAPI